MDINYNALGEKIRKERQRQRYTQEKLSELCDISTSYLGHIERGSRKMSIDTLVTIANVLNVSLDYLLSDDLTQPNAQLSLLNKQLQSASPDKAKTMMNIVKILGSNIDKL